MRVVRRLTHAELVASRSAPIREDDPYLSHSYDPKVPYRRSFTAHDPQTTALIRQYKDLERLPHSESIIDLLEEWRWLDSMAGPEQKQRFLEPIIAGVRREPEVNEARLVFLLIVCEPVRRGVSKAFVRARSGLDSRGPSGAPTDWHQREEARRLNEIDRQTLYDVTRAATLDALFGYPSPPPKHFFGWLRSTVAHGALNHLQDELPQIQTTQRTASEAEAIQAAIHGLGQAELLGPRDESGRARWNGVVHLRSVFEITETYFDSVGIRTICGAAIGRLPRCQREVIDHIYFGSGDVVELADRRGIARSTVDNHKAQALSNLRGDDLLFAGLLGLGKVRDRARALALKAQYPDGKLPDGRRIVVIEEAA